MRQFLSTLSLTALFCAATFGQSADYPYIVKTFAGTWPLGDGGPAASALLYYPHAAVPDGAGNLYILDSGNYLIRKVAADQKISTVAVLPIYTYDMKRGSDGTLYVSGDSQVLKVSPAGVVTVIAGNGDYGFAGDGGQATRARVGAAYGVAVDNAGNVYFTDVSTGSHRVREVTTDGVIQTIAGVGAGGFNGDNQAATAAALWYPSGIGIDAGGNLYVADYNNSRIRKFKVGGTISTFAGASTFGQPVNGPAAGNRLGTIEGIYVDPAGTVFATDTTNNVAFKVSASGTLTVLAGSFDAYSHPEDGPALSVSLRFPWGIGADAAGNVYIADDTHRIRTLTPSGANLTTLAGKMHFAGDGGPATSALLNEPSDLALDPQGNAFISDAANYLVRKVATDGKISTYAGKVVPGLPVTNSSIFNAKLPYIVAEAADSGGAIYLAGYAQVYKVTPDGTLTIIAGSGFPGNGGDGGKATQATFSQIDSIAVDSTGRVYVADLDANRVRVIAPDTGIITAFAGTGSVGRGGDGQLATSAQFNFSSAVRLAVDPAGSVYVTDDGNFEVRMVDKAGIITTVVGNGTFAHPDGVRATAGGFPLPTALAVDGAGNLYVGCDPYLEVYRVSGGILRRIAGGGSDIPVDGSPALSVFFSNHNLEVDANRDVYSVDLTTSTVRKLVMNSPTAVSSTDGDRQTGPVGQALPKALKVQVMGRAGIGVAGVTVNFAVTAGSGRVSAGTTTTGADGVAGVTLTVGPEAGPVTVTATAAGTTLGPVTFTATGTGAPVTCGLPQPTIASVRSAGDFGGSATFASGSWLEIKGSNLSASTRSWGGDDFTGPNAPTSLDGVTVTINGKRAFVGYISPGQINVQAPGDSTTGSVDVAVATSSCSTATVKAEKAATAGGLLAPGAFNIGGQQYAAALFADGFYVGATGLIPGVPFRPAKPGDNITLYGIGFGDVTPAIAPGVVVSSASNVPGLTITFGTTSATVGYAGLAPDAVGLYQFNVVVPDVPDGDHRVVVKIGGTAISQTAYLTVKR
jgi:uncharacterized protein (TIGR03437 family)